MCFNSEHESMAIFYWFSLVNYVIILLFSFIFLPGLNIFHSIVLRIVQEEWNQKRPTLRTCMNFFFFLFKWHYSQFGNFLCINEIELNFFCIFVNVFHANRFSAQEICICSLHTNKKRKTKQIWIKCRNDGEHVRNWKQNEQIEIKEYSKTVHINIIYHIINLLLCVRIQH